MSLRASGAADAAAVSKDIGSRSSSEVAKYKRAVQSAEDSPCTEISGNLALSDLVEGKMTRKTYRLIRKRELENGARVYPSYHKVAEVKSCCYPPGIKVTETTAKVPLQSLLDHRTSTILYTQRPVINTVSREDVRHLVLIVKYGFDGSSGQSQYKQTFDDENASDSSMLLTSLVPLRLTSRENPDLLIWQNPRPSSPRFCNPIKIEYIRENVTSTLQENKYLDDQIAKLVPFETCIDLKDITVTYKLLFTMVDGKVRNTLTGTSSNMRCYLCGATSKQFKKIEEVRSLPVEEEQYKFGLASLHAWIHFMEFFVHLAYKLEIKKWQARSEQDKKSVQMRKLSMQKGFKQRLGLIIDTPKVGGFGNSNDGNTAKRFFANSSVSAEILGLDVKFLHRAHTIMQVLSCGFGVNVPLFEHYCKETAEMIVPMVLYAYVDSPGANTWYPYCRMGTTVHRELSEEAQESRNKDIKNYRQKSSRKSSRVNTMADVMHWLLLSSDPLISSLRLTPPKKSESLSRDAIRLLLPEYVKMAENESLDKSDTSSDMTDDCYMND